ncbi:myelin-oligodendrocyte glycoprotein [Leptonychotes weddellii]|uniref:Myelin-oligodendrocyte glycoprotein n=1 Tax=Leptonychotes weddellii TaxID=9713 RepID=A0A7F8QAK6_LEPWE|nr:myelin-oligodendrocyte glycoprotein [Leptonychotes weddellii]
MIVARAVWYSPRDCGLRTGLPRPVLSSSPWSPSPRPVSTRSKSLGWFPSSVRQASYGTWKTRSPSRKQAHFSFKLCVLSSNRCSPRLRAGPGAAAPLCLSDPFYWISPGVLVLIAVLPVLLLQITVGLVYLCLQHRLRGKLRAEIENLHRTFDPHFLRVPCWKITLFVLVPVLGPLLALVICYEWLHGRLAGQFLEELRNPF